MAGVSQVFSRLQLNIKAALASGALAMATLPLTGHAKRLLQHLYAHLIAPLGPAKSDWRRLVFVPYGALHYMPFGLLHDGGQYLIEKHEVVVLPAATLAARPGPRQKPGALILAHSRGGSLPQTQAEAIMVRRILGGLIYAENDASKSVLRAAATQVLHIAAHGHFRADQPDLSYLELADGQVYTDDLLQQDLNYELVTLSACETGRAQSTGGELIGLGRGFLYAGAGALVMSLWPVVDNTTLQVMEGMYRALQAGQSKSAALRAGQQQLLFENNQLHPAFWGAFQLIGDACPLTS
jgi:CHAT domain-containing protein